MAGDAGAKSTNVWSGVQILWRRLTNARVAVATILLGGTGLVLLFLSSDDDLWRRRAAAQAFTAQLGGVLIAGVALYGVWELAARRTFAQEVLAAVRLSADVERTGLVEILDDYKIVDWSGLFQRATNIDVFFAYASSWRTTHDAELKVFLGRPGSTLRVFLAHSGDDEQLKVLARRFDMTVDELRFKINEAEKEYGKLGQGRPGTVHIEKRRDAHLFAAYRFDDTVVVTMYSHRRERTPVPTFVFRKPGSLFSFFEAEFGFFAKPDEIAGGNASGGE